VEDYRPLATSLERLLASLSWKRLGVAPFISGDVPFLVNNDGRLSADAAALLFANLHEAEPPGNRIEVLELGAGSGLFARYLLDEFRLLCERASRDYYARLHYFVTDGSAATVEFWQRAEIFREHLGHVTLRVCDANDPSSACAGPLRAIFCNYVLDSLPAAVLQPTEAGWEQLHARTWIADDRALLRQYTALSPEEIQQCAASSDPEERERLLSILPLLESESSFLAVGEDGPLGIEKLNVIVNGAAFAYNYGALSCLDASLDLLDPAGFVLVNDYGPVRAENLAASARGKRFGPCEAIGLNFPLLEEHLQSAGVRTIKPEGDDDCGVHARLLLRGRLCGTQQAFESRFSADAQRFLSEPIEQARTLAGLSHV
jgi:hypothetical protein